MEHPFALMSKRKETAWNLLSTGVMNWLYRVRCSELLMEMGAVIKAVGLPFVFPFFSSFVMFLSKNKAQLINSYNLCNNAQN